ncbi:MAG: hypothetical protein ACOX8Q_01840 [Christensenellales bacterium]
MAQKSGYYRKMLNEVIAYEAMMLKSDRADLTEYGDIQRDKEYYANKLRLFSPDLEELDLVRKPKAQPSTIAAFIKDGEDE